MEAIIFLQQSGDIERSVLPQTMSFPFFISSDFLAVLSFEHTKPSKGFIPF